MCIHKNYKFSIECDENILILILKNMYTNLK